jgi:hypothetical protein
MTFAVAAALWTTSMIYCIDDIPEYSGVKWIVMSPNFVCINKVDAEYLLLSSSPLFVGGLSSLMIIRRRNTKASLPSSVRRDTLSVLLLSLLLSLLDDNIITDRANKNDNMIVTIAMTDNTITVLLSQ